MASTLYKRQNPENQLVKKSLKLLKYQYSVTGHEIVYLYQV